MDLNGVSHSFRPILLRFFNYRAAQMTSRFE